MKGGGAHSWNRPSRVAIHNPQRVEREKYGINPRQKRLVASRNGVLNSSEWNRTRFQSLSHPNPRMKNRRQHPLLVESTFLPSLFILLRYTTTLLSSCVWIQGSPPKISTHTRTTMRNKRMTQVVVLPQENRAARLKTNPHSHKNNHGRRPEWRCTVLFKPCYRHAWKFVLVSQSDGKNYKLRTSVP